MRAGTSTTSSSASPASVPSFLMSTSCSSPEPEASDATRPVAAALSGDPADARKALLAHPLVGQWGPAEELVERLLAADEKHLHRFAAPGHVTRRVEPQPTHRGGLDDRRLREYF